MRLVVGRTTLVTRLMERVAKAVIRDTVASFVSQVNTSNLELYLEKFNQIKIFEGKKFFKVIIKVTTKMDLFFFYFVLTSNYKNQTTL